MTDVSFDDVLEAQRRIAPHIHRTPVVRSATLDAELSAHVFFKCENLQKVGAFKARGALNAVLSLDEATAASGVVAHSSGNHGQALAFAAARRGIPATIVMPDSAPSIKVDAVRDYGATVVMCAHEDRHAIAERIRQETGATEIHPFEDPRVIAGQGTAAIELLEETPDLDVVITPIGGGGLMSGTSIAVRALRGDTRLVGAEPEQVDDAARSIASGVLQPEVKNPKTRADGLIAGLGSRTFEILRGNNVEIVTVSEQAILDAARFHASRMKLVVEPSGATGLAAVWALGDVAGTRIGVIISGGNTDLAWVLD